MLSVIGFSLLVWFVVWRIKEYFREREHKDIQRRTHEQNLIGQNERELRVQKELEIRALITSEIDKHLHRALEIYG